jgi:hypothetical protein
MQESVLCEHLKIIVLYLCQNKANYLFVLLFTQLTDDHIVCFSDHLECTPSLCYFSHGKPVLVEDYDLYVSLQECMNHIDCRRGVMLYVITVLLITKDIGVTVRYG